MTYRELTEQLHRWTTLLNRAKEEEQWKDRPDLPDYINKVEGIIYRIHILMTLPEFLS
jgi:hypothetical protein